MKGTVQKTTFINVEMSESEAIVMLQFLKGLAGEGRLHPRRSGEVMTEFINVLGNRLFEIERMGKK